MLCPNCGHSNIQGTEFCGHCGTDLAGLDIPEAERGFMGRLVTDSIGDLPLAPAPIVTGEINVAEAVKRMRRARQGCVLIADGGRPVGIFTERDLLLRVLREGRDPRKTRVDAVMTADPVTLATFDPPAFAIHLMVTRDFRHLPIVDDENLEGLVSVRSILRYLHEQVIGGGDPDDA